MNLIKFFILGLLLIISFKNLFAFGYNINPTKLVISEEQKIATLTINNTSKVKTSLQIDVVSWDQINGEEVYHFTKDIIASPKIFTLLPGRSQIIRMGLKRKFDPRIESSYRVIVRELVMPQGDFAPRKIRGNVKISLNMNIPLFVEPKKSEIQKCLWKIRKNSAQTLNLICHNKSNKHFFISDIRLLNKKYDEVSNNFKAYAYLLPHKEKGWNIPLKQAFSENMIKIDYKINNENHIVDVVLPQ